MSRLTRDGTTEPVSRDQILRHARGQGNIIFPVQLTTSRIGNLTRLIHTLLYVMTIHTYIHTYMGFRERSGSTTAPSIPTRHSLITITASGIRRKLTAPYTPQQNGPVESGLSRAIKAGYAARLEVDKLFPDIHLEKLKGVRDPDDSSFCGLSLFCGYPRGSTAWRRRRTVACFPRTKYPSGTARRFRSCRSASWRTIAFQGELK